MLTFEWDKDSGKLEIHADSEGLQDLVTQIEKLQSIKGNEHLHLMTEDWGGEELSDDKQNEKSELIHHVEIFKWVVE
jgi:hypothetical protein